MGQLSIPDLVLVLLIANGVQNAMVGENTSLLAGIAAAITLIVLDRVADVVESRSDRARRALEGEPRLLVRDGVVLDRALKEEKVTDGRPAGGDPPARPAAASRMSRSRCSRPTARSA